MESSSFRILISLCALIRFASGTTIPCAASASYSTDGTYSASNCLFSSLTGATNGGAIFVNSTSASLSVISSIFDACYSSSCGGAIYIIGSNFTSTLACGFDCWSYSSVFIYAALSNLITLTQTSMTRCSNTSTAIYSSSAMYGCPMKLWSTNVTSNLITAYGSAFTLSSSSLAKAVFENYVNCTTYRYGTLICGSITDLEYSHSNFIGNYQTGSTTRGMIENEGCAMSIRKCVFIGNSLGCDVWSVSSPVTNIFDCWFAHYDLSLVVCVNETVNCYLNTTCTLLPNAYNFSISSARCYVQNGMATSQSIEFTLCHKMKVILPIFSLLSLVLALN